MVDYAQQEARIFADRAGIKEMLDTFYEGRDINSENANRCWGGDTIYAAKAASIALELGSLDPTPAAQLLWEELQWSKRKAEKGAFSSLALNTSRKWLKAHSFDIVKAEKSIKLKPADEGKKVSRTKAKNVLYAKIYGGGATAVQDMLYCTNAEARETLNRFDEVFPGIQAYSNIRIKQARKDGYIQTAYGDKIDVDVQKAYQGVNYEVQGTAARMMKYAIVRCGRYLRSTGLDAHMVMSIHDELDFEIREGHLSVNLLKEIKCIMTDTSPSNLKVPMAVEFSITRAGWNDGEELEVP